MCIRDSSNGKPSINEDVCRGCRRCQRECANGGLVFDNEKRKMHVNHDQCVGCGRCLAKCPIHMNIVKVIKTLGEEHA